MNEFIPVAKPLFAGNEKMYLNECFDSGWISSAGRYIISFEKIVAEYCGVPYAVAVSNGTVALHLALVALGIGAGDEVIVPDLTFAATANAVIYTGATPLLADVETESWTIDIEKCHDLITSKTRAIIPVHLYGQPCQMNKVLEFAHHHQLFVVEDCAEAHSAEFQGKKVGSFGDVNCFSFYGNKIVTTGEGGICLTSDHKTYEKLQVLRDHGMDKNRKYWHNQVGYNYRMTNIQAAIGCAQMEQIHEFIKVRRNIQQQYDQLLGSHPNILIQKDLTDRKKVCWIYSVEIVNDELGISIQEIQQRLRGKGIDSRPFFIPLHEMPPYRGYRHSQLSESVRISRHGLSLPTFSDLSEDQIKFIAKCLIQILND
jgi:perosamine synthetase